ncbi:TonB-dependent receptor [Sphingomonas sp.]
MRYPSVCFGLLAGVSTIAIPAHAQSLDEREPQEDEILVMGQRGALNRAIEAERRADNLVNIVTADDIGQFADQNTAEALQRLPGVTIGRNEGEGRTVSVRGLPSGFTQVTVNGARIGTSEAGSSTVALDVLPADLLGQIELNKTYTPDMDGDTIGGAVELKSLSAFQQNDDITAIRAEASISEYAEKVSPKASASFARKLMGNTLGIALSASYFKRFIDGDDLRNESGLLSVTRNGRDFLYPGEINQRHEIGVRERYGATLNIEYRPNDDQEYFLRGQYSRLNDDDIRIQSIWQTERATGNEVQQIADGSAQFIDVRQRNQIFFQPTTDTLWTVSGGTRHRFGAFELATQLDYSSNRWEQNDGVRGRFEIDDIGTRATFGRETSYVEAFRDRNRPDPANLAAYRFSNLLFIEELRKDDIFTARGDLRYDVNEKGFVRFGAKYRSRDKSADKSEFNGTPSAVGVNVDLSQIPLLERPNTRFNTFGPFPALADAQALYLDTRDRLLAVPTFQRQDNSFASDFALGEDVTAAYGLVNYDFSRAFKFIGGVRMEHTRFTSQGFFIETDDNGLAPGTGAPLTPVDLGTYERSYTHWLPSAVLRYEPRETLLFRASYGRGVKRPEFDDSVNQQRVRVNPDNAFPRVLTAGNPFLEALTANNYDVSAAWFPNRGTAIQVSFFHKDIDNFFLSLITNDLSQTPIQLPAGVPTDFDRIFTTINGGKARVTGVEIAYSQTFPNAPGLLAGLFASANVTLADSEADLTARPDAPIPFPGQADLTANVSVGYENEVFSLRTSVTHRGRTLSGVADNPIEDRFRAPYTQTDLNLRFNVAKGVQIYGDAINIFAVKDSRYYQGDGFGFFERVQDFGPTYQAGVRVTF